MSRELADPSLPEDHPSNTGGQELSQPSVDAQSAQDRAESIKADAEKENQK